MSSSPHPALMRCLILLSLVLCAALSASCASAPKPLLIEVPATLKAPCPRADVGPLETVGDLGALVLRQEAALTVCNGRREAVVAIVDAHKRIAQPDPWWKFWD